MEERVHPLVSREFRRHALHEVRVNNGKRRHHGREEDTGLLFRRLIRNDRSHIHFGTGARGRRNRDNRSRRGRCRFLSAVDRQAVVPDRPGVRHHERDAFAAVHHGAAAKRHDKVAACFLPERRAVHHVIGCRVRADLIKEFVPDPREIKFLLKRGKVPVLLHRSAVRGHDERFLPRKRLFMQRLQLPRSEKDFGGHMEDKVIHAYSPDFLSAKKVPDAPHTGIPDAVMVEKERTENST